MLNPASVTNPTSAAEEHARKYGAKYIPLLIRFDREGHETARTNGLPPDELLSFLQAGQ